MEAEEKIQTLVLLLQVDQVVVVQDQVQALEGLETHLQSVHLKVNLVVRLTMVQVLEEQAEVEQQLLQDPQHLQWQPLTEAQEQPHTLQEVQSLILVVAVEQVLQI